MAFVFVAPLVWSEPATAEYRRAAKSKAGAYVLDANIGYVRYMPFIKPGRWYPVWAMIEARESDVDGVLVFNQERNTLRVEIPIHVSKGDKKLFRSAYRPATLSPKLDVEIRASRLGRDTIPVNYRAGGENSQHVLVISEETGGFSFLNRNAASEGARQAPNPAGELSVLYGTVDLLPDDPILLEPLDAIILNGPMVRSIRIEQWDAIQTWVSLGGRLMIGAGQYQPFIQQSVLKDPFGASLPNAEPTVLDALFSGAKAGKTASVPAAWPALSTGAWERVWVGDARRPFLATLAAGRGMVSICAAALDSTVIEAINSRDDAMLIWGRTLERHGESPLSRIAREDEPLLSAGLQSPFSFGLASAGWVFSFLACYVIIALPGAWILSSKIKRREWFWPSAILMATGFVSYGYLSGPLSRERSVLLDEVTFISRGSESGKGRAATLSAVYAPWRFSKDLRADARVFACGSDAGAMNQRYGGARDDLYSDRPLSASFGASTSLRDFAIYPASARNLRSDFMVEIKRAVVLEAPIERGANANVFVQGRLRNETPWTFTRYWISDGLRRPETGGQLLEIGGQLRPGETADLTKQSVGIASSSFGAVPRAYTGEARPQDSQTWRGVIIPAIRAAMQKTRRPLPGRQGRNQPDPFDYYWQYQGGVNSANDDGPQPILFIGECETSLSPLMEGLRISQSNRSLFYEQVLTNPGAPSSQKELAAPETWRIQVADSGGMGMRQDAWAPTSKDGNLVIRLNAVDLQLVPDHPFFADANDGAEVSLALKDLKQGGSGQQGNDLYKIAGCPVSIYNVREQKWEEAGIWTGQTYKLRNLRNYLHPATSAIMLRLHADQDDVRFRPKDAGAEDPATLKSGKDIFGSQSPTGSNRGRNYQQPYQNAYGSAFAVVSDVKVSVLAANERPSTTP